jgi:3D (Asp-Asp-Asp) domain-containing protein
MNYFTAKRIIPKKYRKFLIGMVLFSLIHNLLISPVQAATDSTNTPAPESTTPALIGKKIIIKSPGSQEKRLEQLASAPKNSKLPKAAADFKLVAKTSDFHIGLLEDEQNANSTPISTPVQDIKGTERWVSMTAYNSEVGQTDNGPCTTANGFNVCEHGIEDTVAANFLPFGAKIMIPDQFPGRVFIVRDRMARRFTNRVDIWMIKKSDALQFGVRQSRIIILEN